MRSRRVSLVLIHNALEFLIIKHGNFRLASPTPHHLHGQIIAPAKGEGPESPAGPHNSVLIPYVLASLHLYFLLLAMYRIQRPPKRIQCLIRRRQNLFLIPIRVLFQPFAPSRPMRLVRFLMDREIRQPF